MSKPSPIELESLQQRAEKDQFQQLGIPGTQKGTRLLREMSVVSPEAQMQNQMADLDDGAVDADNQSIEP